MTMNSKSPYVVAVCRHSKHQFSKTSQDAIQLVAGQGVVEDAHYGYTVQHRSRIRIDPTQINLRQVHLIEQALLIELNEQGFDVGAGSLGENILTAGIDLRSLPTHTRLFIGTDVCLSITGLRNPCRQLDDYQTGLMAAVLSRDEAGGLVRKAGVMAIVMTGGTISPMASIRIQLPPPPYIALDRV